MGPIGRADELVGLLGSGVLGSEERATGGAGIEGPPVHSRAQVWSEGLISSLSLKAHKQDKRSL
jgi:hypothetical protein